MGVPSVVLVLFVPSAGSSSLSCSWPSPASKLSCFAQLMSVVYVALVAVWIGEMLRLSRHVLPVHFLCLVCVLVKAVQTILVAVYYRRQVTRSTILCRKRPVQQWL